MTQRWPASEADLAAVVVAWLERECWDVYQEVSIGPVADIVARRGPVLWVIETKRAMSLSVIGQAQRWAPYAHLRSVAVPSTRGDAGRDMAHEVCRRWGIGVLDVSRSGVHERVDPRLTRHRSTKLRDALAPEHRTYAAAGSARGERWSHWRGTCDRLRKAVAESPGVTLREALGGMEHHYSSNASARTSMAHWVREGKVSGVRCVAEGRVLRLYPAEPGA